MNRRELGLIFLPLTASLPACAQAPPPGATVAPAQAVVYECTFLRALTGQTDRLKRFIRANWFEMDAVALRQGLMLSYWLLEPRADAGDLETLDWDLLVQVGYATPGGYRDIAPAFDVIRRAHTTVPIGGLDFAALGRIIRSSAWVDRSQAG